ncbi:NUDIX domain-containing protein [Streptomyces cyaneofuscatus]|uniref:NUDIX domain-containing protein n=1 Tax=Streptomyces sp. 021-4 TaxID=2789260 RepID=UPI0039F642E9
MDTRVQTRVSAYAVAVEDGRLLLTRLSDASPIFTPGLWHLPGGGIDPGEQPVDALRLLAPSPWSADCRTTTTGRA